MAIILDGDGRTPMSGGGARPPMPGNGADLVKDTDTENFMTDVIEASRTAPVIVDFWAPWCGPCKTLGPLLEKLVRQSGGKVRMVKINVDENQELAAQFRIQSIPAVYAFKDGRPADGFMGALPESQLKQFIDRLVGGSANTIDEMLADAKQLFDDGHPEAAQQAYQQVLAQDQGNPLALAGALRCLIAIGENDTATEVLGQLPPELLAHPEVQAVKTMLDLASEAAGEIGELEAKVAANPGDHQARYNLAMAYFGAGRRQETADTLLDIMKADRTWNDEQARKQLLKLFEAFGPTDPVTVGARRKLSALLFS
ncbi:MAG: thioredoxin [Rhodospirillaceae bacterium]